MPEAQAPSPPPAPRTPEGNATATRPAPPFLQALRRHPVRVALLALFLLALLFHRPLLNTALASFLRIAAPRAGFSLSLSLHGNPFGHCVL
ncbi:MAG: hypothetical protein RLZZ244_2966, partial [Verrucomicrobiota bacterium]